MNPWCRLGSRADSSDRRNDDVNHVASPKTSVEIFQPRILRGLVFIVRVSDIVEVWLGLRDTGQRRLERAPFEGAHGPLAQSWDTASQLVPKVVGKRQTCGGFGVARAEDNGGAHAVHTLG